MMLRTTTMALGVAALLSACGKSDDSNDKKTATPAASDDYAMTTVATGQVDDAIEALADGTAPSASGFVAALTAGNVRGKYGMASAAWDPACVLENDNAKVTWSFNKPSDEQVHTLGGGKLTRTLTRARTGSLVRTWTGPTDHPVTCNEKETHAVIDWSSAAAVAGLKLSMASERTKTDTLSFKNEAGAELVNVTKTFGVSGTRTVEWASVTTGADSITVVKKVTASNVKRTHVITKTLASGVDAEKLSKISKALVRAKDVNLSSTVTVVTPLEIEVVRALDTKHWKTRTVKSGATLATQADASAVKSTFANVHFELTDDATKDPCMPISGTITGKVFAKAEDATDDAKATRSFTITFGDGVASLAVDGAAAEVMDDYNPQCDLAD